MDGKIVDWEVVQRGPDHYLLKASYKYEWKGVEYKGEQLFENPIFQNPYSAAYTIDKHKGQRWQVWVHKSDPSRALLQRLFSVSLMVKTALMLSLSLYAFWIRQATLKAFQGSAQLGQKRV